MERNQAPSIRSHVACAQSSAATQFSSTKASTVASHNIRASRPPVTNVPAACRGRSSSRTPSRKDIRSCLLISTGFVVIPAR
jgi:hypothetical protein